MTVSIDIQHNNIKCHYAPCRYAECRYAECHDYLNIMLSVVMPSVARLNVIMLSVVVPFLDVLWCKLSKFYKISKLKGKHTFGIHKSFKNFKSKI